MKAVTRHQYIKGNKPPEHKEGCSCFRCTHISPNKGKKGIHLSIATEFKKGEHNSKKTEFKKGMKPWNTGKKWSEEAKEKMSLARKGIYTNEKHPQWKGDKVGYQALHTWVNRHLGKAIWCCHCMSCKNIQWANISHKYLRDLNDWMQLCAKCHFKYDDLNFGRKNNKSVKKERFGLI